MSKEGVMGKQARPYSGVPHTTDDVKHTHVKAKDIKRSDTIERH